jgi:hypothetical protein
VRAALAAEGCGMSCDSGDGGVGEWVRGSRCGIAVSQGEGRIRIDNTLKSS